MQQQNIQRCICEHCFAAVQYSKRLSNIRMVSAIPHANAWHLCSITHMVRIYAVHGKTPASHTTV